MPSPPYFQHEHEKYLYMHYCIRQDDRKRFFCEQNLEKLKVKVSEEEDDLAYETGYNVAKVSTLRKGVEECMIQTVFTTEENVKKSRAELITTDKAHDMEIGDILWKNTMKKFKSYFSDELAKKNRKWFKKLDGKPAGPKKDKDGFVSRGDGVRVMHLN